MDNQLIAKSQYGFRTGLSTSHAVSDFAQRNSFWTR